MATDPAISRIKFDREVTLWHALEPYYRGKGIWLLDAKFPTVFAVLAAAKAQPVPIVVCGVEVDFTDYDAQPPSVRLVNPFTRKPLNAHELPHKFLRQTMRVNPTSGEMEPGDHVALVQAFEDGVPFICLPGTREYHDNPAHSGDSWLLHRSTGQGSLHFILETLWRYGADPVHSIMIQFQVLIGLSVRQIPL